MAVTINVHFDADQVSVTDFAWGSTIDLDPAPASGTSLFVDTTEKADALIAAAEQVKARISAGGA